jgi:hypothetical protein
VTHVIILPEGAKVGDTVALEGLHAGFIRAAAGPLFLRCGSLNKSRKYTNMLEAHAYLQR